MRQLAHSLPESGPTGPRQPILHAAFSCACGGLATP
jgi:hypothetical protein